MPKYRLLRERLLAEGVLHPRELEESGLIDRATLLLAHTPEYLDAVFSGTLAADDQRRLGFSWSAALVTRSRASVFGTVLAARAALEDGVAGNLAGGTHHALGDRGTGVCGLASRGSAAALGSSPRPRATPDCPWFSRWAAATRARSGVRWKRIWAPGRKRAAPSASESRSLPRQQRLCADLLLVHLRPLFPGALLLLRRVRLHPRLHAACGDQQHPGRGQRDESEGQVPAPVGRILLQQRRSFQLRRADELAPILRDRGRDGAE